jgi:hypothetical protein
MRAASGAPGPDYWQQQVDYVINVTLDEKRRRIIGSEDIKYSNNSPDTLTFLWVQLDQNRFRQGLRGNALLYPAEPGGAVLRNV